MLGLTKDYPRLKLVLVRAAETRSRARSPRRGCPRHQPAHSPTSTSFEQLAATKWNSRADARHGITVALASIGASGGDHVLRQFAGNLVAITKVPGHTGLDWGQAFAAITSGPAEALGMGGDFGSLRPAAAPMWCCGTATRWNCRRSRSRCGSTASRNRCDRARPTCAIVT
ncbi:hypothetical protein AB5I41_12685 [Sphingomonas sp. MMS24-JH45]